jgi:hypothetical protein
VGIPSGFFMDNFFLRKRFASQGMVKINSVDLDDLQVTH